MLNRRVFLAGVGGLGLTSALVSCTEVDGRSAPSIPSPDETAVAQTIADARVLHTAASALAGARSPQSELLTAVTGVHAQHLEALGASPTSTPTVSATASTPATTTAAGAAATAAGAAVSVPVTIGQLITAEWAAARRALRAAESADGAAFAVLFARIAAARAIDTDLLAAAIKQKPKGVLKPSATTPPPASPTATPTATPSSTTPTSGADASPATRALDRLLGGQHAAVFAYALIVARTTGARHDLARELWADHRVERDQLSAELLGIGVEPTPAASAYDVGTPPTSNSRAAALAGRVEFGLTALAVDVVADAGGGLRVIGADQLVLAARRSASWLGRPIQMPGLTTAPKPTATAT